MSDSTPRDDMPTAPEALLRLKSVLDLTGLSASTIYRMMDDGTFPRPRRIGMVATAWLQSELVAWMHACPVADPMDVRVPHRKTA